MKTPKMHDRKSKNFKISQTHHQNPLTENQKNLKQVNPPFKTKITSARCLYINKMLCNSHNTQKTKNKELTSNSNRMTQTPYSLIMNL